LASIWQKNVFQVYAVDERGRAVLRKQFRRDQLTAFFVNLPPCLIGMEALQAAAARLQYGPHSSPGRC